MNKKSFFLIFVASGVFLISLSYGIVPNITLSYLYGIEVDGVNLLNIFRAIMGLYIGFVIFWIIGALVAFSLERKNLVSRTMILTLKPSKLINSL